MPFDPSDFVPALKTELLILQPTPFCNIDCSYCYLPQRNNAARMPLLTLRRVAERLRDDELAAPEMTVVWHAGEPLVVPHSWYEDAFGTLRDVLGTFTRLNHSMQTNATLIDARWCELFRRHQVRVGVSVDGPADLHDAHRRTRQGRGTHAQVVRGMSLLREQGIGFHAIAVVTPATFAQADRFIDFFEANPVSELGCNVDEAEGGHKVSSLSGHESAHGQFLRRLLERSRQQGSRLRVRELAHALYRVAQAPALVQWRGHRWPLNTQVLPFAMLNVAYNGQWSTFSPELLGQPAPGYDDFVFGDVHEAGFLLGAQGQAFARTWSDIVRGTQRCESTCAYFGYCGGGAPVNKFYENGALDSGETLYCRSVVQRPFDTVLQQWEADQVAARSPPVDALQTSHD